MKSARCCLFERKNFVRSNKQHLADFKKLVKHRFTGGDFLRKRQEIGQYKAKRQSLMSPVDLSQPCKTYSSNGRWSALDTGGQDMQSSQHDYTPMVITRPLS